MKYLLPLALALSLITASLAGCSYDVTHSHDIYRAQYKYTPLPQDNSLGLPPDNLQNNQPPQGSSPAPGAPPPQQPGVPPAAPGAGAPPQ